MDDKRLALCKKEVFDVCKKPEILCGKIYNIEKYDNKYGKGYKIYEVGSSELLTCLHKTETEMNEYFDFFVSKDEAIDIIKEKFGDGCTYKKIFNSEYSTQCMTKYASHIFKFKDTVIQIDEYFLELSKQKYYQIIDLLIN